MPTAPKYPVKLTGIELEIARFCQDDRKLLKVVRLDALTRARIEGRLEAFDSIRCLMQAERTKPEGKS